MSIVISECVSFYRRTGSMLLTPYCLFAVLGVFMLVLPAKAQEAGNQPLPPAVVQPGAPGQESRILPSTTRATLPPRSAKDTEFMQGMIMHHAQAVEMTALIEARTENKDLRLLGERISHSQSDEMTFMSRWLKARGEAVTAGMDMHAQHQMSGHDHTLMPGMLTPKQMGALREAKGTAFDRLFLAGMIQHHGGALVMVSDLFNTAGGGQDAELFGFATDVDSGQRAEIRIMQAMLEKKTVEETR